MNLNRSFALAALTLAGTALAASAGVPQNWTEPAEPFEIFDDVYWVGTTGLAAYLFTTPDGHILLDVGMPQNAELVMASIRTLGFAVEDIRYLLNSHAHFDHSGGLAKVKAASGAQMLASTADRPALETGVYPGWESRTDLNFPPVEVDRVVDDGDTVSLGAVTLTAHVTPGHSPGCTSWAFTARENGREHDALVFCSASVALNRLRPDPQYPGIVDDYRETFRRLQDLEVDAYLTPHAEQFDLWDKRARLHQGGAHPFVDPGEKDRKLAGFEAAFEAALADQGRVAR